MGTVMGVLVRAAVLTNYFDVARQLGLNTGPLLRATGLNAAVLADQNQQIPIAAAVQLLELSAEATGCPTFGLRMAESRQLSDFGAISLLITQQATLRAALRTLSQYRHLLNKALAIDIEDAGGTAILREEVVSETGPSRQATDLAVGTLFRMCASILGRQWHPYSVNFTHAAPEDTQVHRRIFGGRYGFRLEFNSDFNGITCATSDLDIPIPTADPALARYAEQFLASFGDASPSSVVLDVRKAIYLLMPMGRANIDQVAQGLGLNTRTLQRRLDEAGHSFTDLINEVRRELVVRYMANPDNSVGKIAELLGYSVHSSFTRWFITHFGVPPAQWRGHPVRG